MLTPDPNYRPSAKELLKHPAFKFDLLETSELETINQKYTSNQTENKEKMKFFEEIEQFDEK